MPTINLNELYVKETVKTTKDKDNGVETKYKSVLEKVGDDGVKIVITTNEPLQLIQGEKGLELNIMSTQTTLSMPDDKKKGKK